jgi:hypothetical protein
MFEAIKTLFQQRAPEPVVTANREPSAPAAGAHPIARNILQPKGFDADAVVALAAPATAPDLSKLRFPGHAVKLVSVPVQTPAEVIDWDGEERRTDLPPRSPERIRFLLQYENEIQRDARIVNDRQRYANQRLGRISYAQHEARLSR